MSEENVESLRRAIEAYNRDDLDAAVADMHPDCEYVPSGALPGVRDVVRGPEGYKRTIAWLRDAFDRAHIDVELTDAGDQVLARLTARGRGEQSGVETAWEFWQVWTYRDGKAVSGRGFTDRDEALEAAGLRE
ncbi:MAG: nuclear transport factor 2 family protein [Actinomycetota bacterium]